MAITLAALREHVETDLTDAALQRVLDGAVALVDARAGAPERTIRETVYPMAGFRDYLPLSRRAGAVTSVEQYETAVSAADYALDSSGYRVEHTGEGWLADEHGYQVAYTVAADDGLRDMCVIELCRLDVAHTGEQSTSVAGVSQQQRDLRRARGDILSRLSPGGRAWVR